LIESVKGVIVRDMEALFSIGNLVATVGWILLAAAPRHRHAQTIAGTVIPLSLAAAYLALLVLHLPDARGGFSTLSGVAELFSNRWLLLAGWIHYLAFDLFIGAWETRDAMARGLARVVLVPCLILTFLIGPVGLLAYYAVRRFTSPAGQVAA
jgi:hypothetical protein